VTVVLVISPEIATVVSASRDPPIVALVLIVPWFAAILIIVLPFKVVIVGAVGAVVSFVKDTLDAVPAVVPSLGVTVTVYSPSSKFSVPMVAEPRAIWDELLGAFTVCVLIVAPSATLVSFTSNVVAPDGLVHETSMLFPDTFSVELIYVVPLASSVLPASARFVTALGPVDVVLPPLPPQEVKSDAESNSATTSCLESHFLMLYPLTKSV